MYIYIYISSVYIVFTDIYVFVMPFCLSIVQIVCQLTTYLLAYNTQTPTFDITCRSTLIWVQYKL